MASRSEQDRRLLAVFAHPDDESRITGGTLARYARAGVRVSVYCATRGEAGEVSLDAGAAADLRTRELRQACEILGVARVEVRDNPDGALAEVDETVVLTDLVTLLRSERPDVIITFGQDGRDGHPDHVTIGRIALAAFTAASDPGFTDEQLGHALPPWRPRTLYYTAMARSLAERKGWRWQSFPDEELVSIDISSVFDLKQRAVVDAHASQWAISPFGLTVGGTPITIEYFRLACFNGSAPTSRDDLF